MSRWIGLVLALALPACTKSNPYFGETETSTTTTGTTGDTTTTGGSTTAESTSDASSTTDAPWEPSACVAGYCPAFLNVASLLPAALAAQCEQTVSFHVRSNGADVEVFAEGDACADMSLATVPLDPILAFVLTKDACYQVQHRGFLTPQDTCRTRDVVAFKAGADPAKAAPCFAGATRDMSPPAALPDMVVRRSKPTTCACSLSCDVGNIGDPAEWCCDKGGGVTEVEQWGLEFSAGGKSAKVDLNQSQPSFAFRGSTYSVLMTRGHSLCASPDVQDWSWSMKANGAC